MKYFNEYFKHWFVFGRYKGGNVDLSDGDRDVASNITEEVAVELMRQRDETLQLIEEYLTRLPKAHEAYVKLRFRLDVLKELHGPAY